MYVCMYVCMYVGGSAAHSASCISTAAAGRACTAVVAVYVDSLFVLSTHARENKMKVERFGNAKTNGCSCWRYTYKRASGQNGAE